MSSIDIIIPCYRYGRFLGQCVSSVLTQGIEDLRVLIIDDASPDDTAEVGRGLEKSDSRVNFIRHAANKGHIATYNEGIEWTESTYYLLLSADDYLTPGALLRATHLMNEHPEVGFVFGAAMELNDDGTTSEVDLPAEMHGSAAEKILGGQEFIRLSGASNPVRTPTAIVRTALQKRMGGYRPELPHSGDMEMWLRLASQVSIGAIRACQAVYRRHSNNMSLGYTNLSDLEQRKAALGYFFESCHSSIRNFDVVRREILRALAREAVQTASGAFNAGQAELCEKLTTFALCTSEDVKRSRPYFALRFKHILGAKLSNRLRGAISPMLGKRAI